MVGEERKTEGRKEGLEEAEVSSRFRHTSLLPLLLLLDHFISLNGHPKHFQDHIFLQSDREVLRIKDEKKKGRVDGSGDPIFGELKRGERTVEDSERN